MARVSISKKDAAELLKFCESNSESEFFFAKGHGAYFGATASSEDMGNSQRCIKYINGMDPEKDEFWEESASSLLGDDDFGVNFPISWLVTFFDACKQKNKRRFTIEITTSQVKLIL